MTTDKVANKLMPEYERILAPYKDKPFAILEVGTYKGGFLEWLVVNFPKAKVFGIDLRPVKVEGAKTYAIDQNDTDGLKAFGVENGPFDVVIEDGAHRVKESKNTFEALWPHVSGGGLYVVEDWVAGIWSKRDPGRFGFAEGMDDFVFDLVERSENIGVSESTVIYHPPKCSLAIYKKKL
jgi:SAM-dependent methyltransferase